MERLIDEYEDIKTQQECVSKTIDTLWKMAQKYQKIKEIINNTDYIQEDVIRYKMICEVIDNGNDD